jgi:plasmid stabilization system protein ParE
MALAVPIFHRLASREFRDAYQHYARQSLKAARRFQDAVEHAIDEIAADPYRWPIFHQNYRWVKTKRFPYVLYFRILDPYHVLIVAVAHGKRRPGYWLRRS